MESMIKRACDAIAKSEEEDAPEWAIVFLLKAIALALISIAATEHLAAFSAQYTPPHAGEGE